MSELDEVTVWPPAQPCEAVVFDWGGVLTSPLRESFHSWLSRDGVDPEHFGQVLTRWLAHDPEGDSPVHALERGELPPAVFEAELAGHLGELGSPVPPTGLLDRMLAGLRTLDATMMSLVSGVREAGLRTAVLSNSWGEHYPDEVFESAFDVIVISGREGMRKPEERIFRTVGERLGVSVTACVLVDDLDGNVTGARRLGMGAVLHRDPPSTVRALAELLGREPGELVREVPA